MRLIPKRLAFWWLRRKASEEERPALKRRHEEWLERRSRNDPRFFVCVGEKEGKPIGPPVEISRLRKGNILMAVAVDDLDHFSILGALTDLVLIKGISANAYRDVSYTTPDGKYFVRQIQPVEAEYVVHIVDSNELPACGFTKELRNDLLAVLIGREEKGWPRGHYGLSTHHLDEITCQKCLACHNEQVVA